MTEYHPAAIPRSEFDPLLPGKVTGACNDASTSSRDGSRQISPRKLRSSAEPSSDDLIAFHLQNAREPNAYSEMAAAMESFRSPRALGWS